jgi:hypothetical protein
VRFVCGRWWRTMNATTPEEAQVSLDRFCATTGDARPRRGSTVGALADAEPLLALPAAPYPATVEVTRPVAANATVAFRGNRYSVPPGLVGALLTLSHRLGTAVLAVHAPWGAAGDPPAGPTGVRHDRAHPRASRRARADRPERVHDRAAVQSQGQPPAGSGGDRRGRPAATPGARSSWT